MDCRIGNAAMSFTDSEGTIRLVGVAAEIVVRRSLRNGIGGVPEIPAHRRQPSGSCDTVNRLGESTATTHEVTIRPMP